VTPEEINRYIKNIPRRQNIHYCHFIGHEERRKRIGSVEIGRLFRAC
jgi:hypothetical protein